MAKLIIQTEKDLNKLQGKFVIQINNHEPDKELMQFDWGFVKEKRLYIVAGFGFVDLYGDITNYESFEKFKNIFNNYLYPHMIHEGKEDGGRFHRLLRPDELKYLFDKILLENHS